MCMAGPSDLGARPKKEGARFMPALYKADTDNKSGWGALELGTCVVGASPMRPDVPALPDSTLPKGAAPVRL